MLVVCTHNNIDALFGRWTMKLQQSNYSTILLLMKSFMDVDKVPIILHLVKEVVNFKGFIAPFMAMCNNLSSKSSLADRLQCNIDQLH